MSIKIKEHLQDLYDEIDSIWTWKDLQEFFWFLEERTEPEELHHLSLVTAWLRNEIRVFDTLQKEKGERECEYPE